MPVVKKHFDAGARRAAIELWRAKVPQRAIMKQLGMSKATMMRVLTFARANPTNPIAKWKKGSGHPTKLTEATLEKMKTKLQKTPTLRDKMYTYIMNKLLFLQKYCRFLIFLFRGLSFYGAGFMSQ
jgi:hypothetical protein